MADKTINGRTFHVSPLPAGEAIALYAEIVQALGAAVHRLPAIIISATSEGEEQGLMGDIAALAAMADVVKAATPDGTRALIQRIVEVARIRRPSGSIEPVDFNGDFTGNLKDILPVARFVLTEQYRDFFIGSGVNGLLSHLKVALQSTKPSASPPT